MSDPAMSAFVGLLIRTGGCSRAADLMRLWIRLRELPAFTKSAD